MTLDSSSYLKRLRLSCLLSEHHERRLILPYTVTLVPVLTENRVIY